MPSMRSNIPSKTHIGETIFLKIHEQQGQKVLACAEKKLIGKKLKKGEIEFIVSEKFYKGKTTTKQELKKELLEADNINLVGEKPIKIAKELKLIDNKNIIMIGKIPHTQIYRI